MITILILVGFYGLSFYGAYKFIQKAHYDEKGKYYNQKIQISNILASILPICNTILTLGYLTKNWVREAR